MWGGGGGDKNASNIGHAFWLPFFLLLSHHGLCLDPPDRHSVGTIGLGGHAHTISHPTAGSRAIRFLRFRFLKFRFMVRFERFVSVAIWQRFGSLLVAFPIPDSIRNIPDHTTACRFQRAGFDSKKTKMWNSPRPRVVRVTVLWNSRDDAPRSTLRV